MESCTSRPGHRVDPLQLLDDLAAGVDLVLHVAGRTAKILFEGELDAGAADGVGQLVALGLVVLGLLVRDAPDVADDVAGDRRVAVDPLPALVDLDTRVVLGPLLQVDRRVLADALGQRQGQERVEARVLQRGPRATAT